MVAWPASLPALPSGVRDRPGDGRIRTGMDIGPPKTRRRSTANVREVGGSQPMILTGTQRATLETFVDTTLSGGVFSFDWDDPNDGTTVAFFFATLPTYANVAPHDVDAKRKWAASFALEIHP